MARSGPLKALLVRLCLCLHFVLVVWRVTVAWDTHYWFLATAIFPFLLEGAYTLIRRKGIEWKWFSPCFFFYMAATLPGIWLLEINRTNTYQAANTTTLEQIAISGLEIPLRLSADTWVLVVEELMLYLMILGRWILPRGKVGREQLSQLLFAFVGIASDIMELFSLFDEDMIRHNTSITYALLGVWSCSIVQFSLTFPAAHRPRRARGLRMAPSQSDPTLEIRHAVIKVELLASLVSLLMQDGPFLVLRLYCIVTYDLITYSLVFFTAKNVLVILLLLYKIVVLCSKRFYPKQDDDDDEEDEEMGKVQQNDKAQEMWDREEKRLDGGFGDHVIFMGDLERVIEGPAKEATKKNKGKVEVTETVREEDILDKMKEAEKAKEVVGAKQKQGGKKGGSGDFTTSPNGSAPKDRGLKMPEDIGLGILEDADDTRPTNRSSEDSGVDVGPQDAPVFEKESTKKTSPSKPVSSYEPDPPRPTPVAQSLVELHPAKLPSGTPPAGPAVQLPSCHPRPAPASSIQPRPTPAVQPSVELPPAELPSGTPPAGPAVHPPASQPYDRPASQPGRQADSKKPVEKISHTIPQINPDSTLSSRAGEGQESQADPPLQPNHVGGDKTGSLDTTRAGSDVDSTPKPSPLSRQFVSVVNVKT